MFAIRYSRPALKTLVRMPYKTALRIQRELDSIASDPNAYRGDWKRLEGVALWRLRVADWRVICDVRERELAILVVKIGARGDVYK